MVHLWPYTLKLYPIFPANAAPKHAPKSSIPIGYLQPTDRVASAKGGGSVKRRKGSREVRGDHCETVRGAHLSLMTGDRSARLDTGRMKRFAIRTEHPASLTETRSSWCGYRSGKMSHSQPHHAAVPQMMRVGWGGLSIWSTPGLTWLSKQVWTEKLEAQEALWMFLSPGCKGRFGKPWKVSYLEYVVSIIIPIRLNSRRHVFYSQIYQFELCWRCFAYWVMCTFSIFILDLIFELRCVRFNKDNVGQFKETWQAFCVLLLSFNNANFAPRVWQL